VVTALAPASRRRGLLRVPEADVFMDAVYHHRRLPDQGWPARHREVHRQPFVRVARRSRLRPPIRSQLAMVTIRHVRNRPPAPTLPYKASSRDLCGAAIERRMTN